MKENSLSAHTQYAACDFLQTMLPCCGERNANSRIVDDLREAQCMKLMLDAVQAHIGKPNLQFQLWWTIDLVLRYIEDSGFFVSGGVAAMSLTLSMYESERCKKCPRRFVLSTFKRACKKSDSVRLINERMVELALSALRKPWIVNDSTMANCCKAFGRLAHDASWAKWFANKGVVADIVKFMEESLNFG